MALHSRYFTPDKRHEESVNAHEELISSLQRINTFNPPVQTCSTGWHFAGLYSGPVSIAYLFYRLSFVYPDLEIKHQSLWDWADVYLDLSSSISRPDPTPQNCGVLNETLSYYAVKAVMTKDPSLALKLCSYQKLINVKSEAGSNEWLCGRAGYLYLLRLALSVFTPEGSPSASKQLSQTIANTVERILATPQPWTWSGQQYLGAAHGTIGIISQVVLSAPDTAPRLQDLLFDVLDQQYPSGNFPSTLPARADQRVQFCHGGPGFVLALQSIIDHFPALTDKISAAIDRARRDILVRGLLTKEPSLCHGIAGNALALGSQEEMRLFLARMTSDEMERYAWMDGAGRNDDFVGLYTGEAGRAWVWAILDKGLPHTCIGFNDL